MSSRNILSDFHNEIYISSTLFFKNKSVINKANKAKAMEPHTSGSKSFARMIGEEESSGMPPSRSQIYIKTRFSQKKGDYVSPEAARYAEAMKSDLEVGGDAQSSGQNMWDGDVYSKHKGPDSKRRVRCMGKLVLDKGKGNATQQRLDEKDEEIAALKNVVASLVVGMKQMNPNFQVDESIIEDRARRVSTGASATENAGSKGPTNNDEDQE